MAANDTAMLPIPVPPQETAGGRIGVDSTDHSGAMLPLDGDLDIPEIGMDDLVFDDGKQETSQHQEQEAQEALPANGQSHDPPVDETHQQVTEESTGQPTAMEVDSGVVQDSGTLDDIVVPSISDLNLGGVTEEVTEEGGVVGQQPTDAVMEEEQLDENGEKIPIYLDLSRMEQWRVDDVCEYLKNSQFGAIYVESFFSQGISGRILYGVDDTQLNAFGVKSAIHRFRILRDIADAKDIARWEQCTQQGGDGGTTLSRFMRFNAQDVGRWCTFLTSREEIGMTINRYNPQLTGYDLMHRNNPSVVLTNAGVVPSDVHKLVQEVNRLKLQNNEALRVVEQIWKGRADTTQKCYYLKPQHLVTPTLSAGRVVDGTVNNASGVRHHLHQTGVYQNQQVQQPRQIRGEHRFQPQQAMGVKTKVKNKLIGQKRARDFEGGNGLNLPSYSGPNVLEWDNATVLTFISGFAFGDRYLRHFRSLQIDGPTLIRLTANTLENVIRVTVKTHVRQMCKAIDELRDMALEEFIERPATQEWVASNPKRARTSVKRVRYSNSGNSSSQSSSALNAVQASLNGDPGQVAMESTMGGGYAQVAARTPDGPSGNGALPKCQLCGRMENIMRCSNCKNAFYCSREHQLQDWPHHQAKCVPS